MQLDPAGGGGAVGIEIDVALQPQSDIDGQLLEQRLHTLHLVPDLLDGIGGLDGSVGIAHQLTHKILLHDMRAGQVRPLLRDLALVGVVAAEEFVDALAGINDLRVLSDCRAPQRKGYRGGVAQGLTHLDDGLGDPREVFLGGDHLDVEIFIEDLGGTTREGRFVKAGFLVTDGVGALRVTCREQIGRVYAAGEEGFFIRKLGIAALLGEDLLHDLADLSGKVLCRLTSVRLKDGLPVAMYLSFCTVPFQKASGRELVHALVKGLCTDRIAVEQVLL